MDMSGWVGECVCACVGGGLLPSPGWSLDGIRAIRGSAFFCHRFLESTGVLTPAARRAVVVPAPRRRWWRRGDGRSEKRADVTLGQAEAVCTGHPWTQLVGRRPALPLDLLLSRQRFAPHWVAASGASLPAAAASAAVCLGGGLCLSRPALGPAAAL